MNAAEKIKKRKEFMVFTTFAATKKTHSSCTIKILS